MWCFRLNEISNAQESSPNLNIPVSQNIPPIHKQSALEYMENEEFLNVGVINIKTMLKGENMNEFPHIILLPGIEGVTPILESLGAKLKADVSCIQNCFDNKAESITQLAQSLLPVN